MTSTTPTCWFALTIACLLGLSSAAVLAQEGSADKAKEATSGQAAENAKQDEDGPMFFFGGEKRETRKLLEGNASIYQFDKHSGEASVLIKKGLSRTDKTAITMEPGQKYRLSLFMKRQKEDQPTKGFVVIKFFTENWRPITNHSVKPSSNVSTLTADAEKGGKSISVSKWKWAEIYQHLSNNPDQVGRYAVVFNAKEDESDLPNWTHHQLEKIEPEGRDAFRVTLKNPMTESYPSGTNVRVHEYQDYPTLGIRELPAEWTEYTMTLSEVGNSNHTVWPGAHYAAIQIMTRNGPLLWDDLRLEKVE